MATVQKAGKQAKSSIEIGADTARDQLGDVIDRVKFGGERLILTRHGKRAVAIVGLDDLAVLEASDAA